MAAPKSYKPNPESLGLLNEFEAAALLRVARSTLESWRLNRKGPRYTKLGRRVLYRQADLEQFAKQRLVEPNGRKRQRVF